MPSKKRKYNARFPAGRIKKIMQTDEEVGKIAQAVPVIISRTLELFVESLLNKSMSITNTRHAKTLTPSHIKQCIVSESRFDFLKDLVKNIPDISNVEEFEEGEEVAFSSSSSNSSTPTTTPSSSSSHHQIQFCLNNYTSSNYHKPNSTQFLAESMIKSQQQPQLHRTTNIEHRAKISRINSLPAPATITSASLNTPTPDLRAPNSFPIQITYPSSLTTTKQSEQQLHQAPIVNIDYSKFSLPMTTATAATTSPTIKIDFSNLSNQTAMMQMPAPTATSSVIPGIDEDYDDI
ncbi:unnamed protein product [Diamesa serratosioi]